MKTKKLVGHVGVDSGLIFITDPCYIKNHKQLYNPEKWQQFCDERYAGRESNRLQPREMCSGIVTNTKHGDGSYPVYATFDEDGSITKIEVVFD